MFDMFDPVFNFVAQILNFFYGVVPNFAIAIMLLTMLVMVVTTPLTLKGTRSMIKMQLLQPELKKIQEKHKGGDRQAMNQEMMAFYQENELNPLGGCFPLLVQAPVFLVLFRLIRGLTRTGDDGTFDPEYLESSSQLYQALDDRTEMLSFGLDLAVSTTEALQSSVFKGLPYLLLVLAMIGAQYLQQKQVSARSTNSSPAMPQQQMLLKVMPAVFGVISIGFPAALVVYWLTSSIYRIGLQGYITHALYGGEDSLGAKANEAAAEARRKKEEAGAGDDDDDPGDTGAGGAKGKGAATGGAKGGAKDGPKGPEGGTKAGANGKGGANTSKAAGSRAGKPHPSSKKKKKRR